MVANAQKLFDEKKKETKQCMARNKEIWKKKSEELTPRRWAIDAVGNTQLVLHWMRH